MEKMCKIRNISRSIISYEAKLQKRYGICLNEGMLLCSLLATEQLSSGEIAAALGLTASNTSKVISNAEEKGFVSRTLGKHDRRQMYFVLTDRGRELISTINNNEITLDELLEKAIGLE